MKSLQISLFFLCLSAGFFRVQAQLDSVRTEYKTEDEAISRSEIQRVIRYITRANVEEKTLIKFGGLPNYNPFTQNGGSFSGGINTELAVERKLNESFSAFIGFDNTFSVNFLQRTSIPPIGMVNPTLWLTDRAFSFNSSARAAVRYYYNMARRIKSGKSANNLSGIYLAAQTRRPIIAYSEERQYFLGSQNVRHVSRNYSLAELSQPSFALQWGIQQRLGLHGYVDFNIGPELTIFNHNDAISTYYDSQTQLSLRLNAIIGLGW